MNRTFLCLYNDMFLSLKQVNCYIGKSIAKPLFLLSLFDCITSYKLRENQIKCDDCNLKEKYGEYSKRYLNKTPVVVPYYHLSSSEFYHLVWKKDFTLTLNRHTPSAKYLREHLQYAKLDDELWELLQDDDNREYFRRNIINRYLLK